MRAAVVTVFVAVCVLGFLYVASPNSMGHYQPGPLEAMAGTVLVMMGWGGLLPAMFISGVVLVVTGVVGAIVDRSARAG